MGAACPPAAAFGRSGRGAVVAPDTGAPAAAYNFYDLLLNIKKLSGNFRVRISSVEPFQISDEIVNLIGSNPDRKSTRLNSSHITRSRMPSSA